MLQGKPSVTGLLNLTFEKECQQGKLIGTMQPIQSRASRSFNCQRPDSTWEDAEWPPFLFTSCLVRAGSCILYLFESNYSSLRSVIHYVFSLQNGCTGNSYLRVKYQKLKKSWQNLTGANYLMSSTSYCWIVPWYMPLTSLQTEQDFKMKERLHIHKYTKIHY